MNVYMVQTKVFYKSENDKEYQVADALEPISAYSSYKKALTVMLSYEKYYYKLGYRRRDRMNNLFPVEHFQMFKEDYRVVIYILKSEVE